MIKMAKFMLCEFYLNKRNKIQSSTPQKQNQPTNARWVLNKCQFFLLFAFTKNTATGLTSLEIHLVYQSITQQLFYS